jgi:glycosyltransferase involved in cell wall biosynthesis
MSGRIIVALVPDAYGGRGGIALYNRQFLRALCRQPDVGRVTALPRSITYGLEDIPAKLNYDVHAANGKLSFAKRVLALAARPGRVDLVVCAHLHLLPFARLLAGRFSCPLLPLVYGVEAWKPTPHAIVNRMCRQIKAFISIRRLTADRLRSWAQIPEAKFYYLPNCIDLNAYGQGPKRADLLARYGIEGRTVVMTTGRLDDTYFDRNKGFDEVLETMPGLLKDVPDAVYVIMGDGDDRPRLEEKARSLGIADRVIFTGYVPEADKADHYRLADVLAMPGSNIYHDRYPYRFAFLEALACGVPVVGSRFEDPSEKDDPDARQLVVQVDQEDRTDIRRGILAALDKKANGIDPLMAKFGFDVFERNVASILTDFLKRPATI